MLKKRSFKLILVCLLVSFLTHAEPQDAETYGFVNLQFIPFGKNGGKSENSNYVPGSRGSVRDRMARLGDKRSIDLSEILDMGFGELEALAEERFQSSPEALSNAKNAILIYELSRLHDRPAEAHQLLRYKMGAATFDEKVNFLGMLINSFFKNYDENFSGSEVSDEEMLAALHGSILTGDPVASGVCRHIHQLPLRFARTLGMKTAFGLSFRSLDSGHLILILTDPADPMVVKQLNYNWASETKGISGPRALGQNDLSLDTGIKLSIFDGKNENVINLPNEQGGILNRVTGGRDSDLSLNYRDESEIKEVGFRTPYGTVRLFFARTPLANQIEMGGVSYNVRMNYSGNAYGDYGVAFFSSYRPTLKGKLNVTGVYGRMTQGIHKNFALSKNLRAQVLGEAHLRGSAYYPMLSTENKSYELNGDFQIDALVSVGIRHSKNRWTNEVGWGTQTQIDVNSDGKLQVPFTPVLQISHDLSYRLQGRVNGGIKGGVTRYNLGADSYLTYSGQGRVDFEKSKTSVVMEVEGRIDEDTPIWLPASEHQGRAQLRQGIFNRKNYVGFDGRQSFESASSRYLGFSLGGAW